MTKWICNFCNKPCYAEPCGSEDYIPSHCLFQDENNWCDWKRVDEPEPQIAGATFNREDWVWLEYARKRDLCHSHEANLLEMAGNLTALKEQVEKLEEQVFDHRAIVAGILERSDDRIQRLEHQMKHHYHHTGVWCETEDGSGTERLVR